MSIITIAGSTFCNSSEIAEKLAEKLEYEFVDRKILFEAAEYFDIPEEDLSHALDGSPPFFNRFTYGREKCLSYISYALLKHLQKDNVVYHGLAGALILKGVPHVLKVRIVSHMKDRIDRVLKSDNISENKARQLLEKNDEKEKRWSKSQFNIDISRTRNYDLVLHLDKMSIDNAVNVILEASKRICFQKTDYSSEIFNDRLKAAKIQSILIRRFPDIHVNSKNGKITIRHKSVFGQGDYMEKQILAYLEQIPEYKITDIDVSSIMNLK